jgi:hypothetical protein
MMDTRCHQTSFCFIKNEFEEWKIHPNVSRELNALEDISVIFNGKTVCKMQTQWYRCTIPADRRERQKDHEFEARLSYTGQFYNKETRAGDVEQW